MLKAMENILDAYNLRARLFPAFIVLTPIGLGIAAWIPLDYQLLGTLGSVAVTMGFATLLQQFARDAGKWKENRLFERWGGRPSVRMLSYEHTALNRQTLGRCHAKLKELAPTLNLPDSLEVELQNPNESKFAYESCNDLLVNKTRDREKFGLLFEENMNYGFRRNLWGLKPFALVVVSAGFATSAAQLIHNWRFGSDVSLIAASCAALCLMLLILWLAVFKPAWVRQAADAYARRLIASCDQLESPKQSA